MTVPVPQANDVNKVAAVVDAVAGGATSAAEIAEALRVHKRQGSYYANAAYALGYVESDGGRPAQWSLTYDGEVFRALTARGRFASMRDHIVESDPFHAHGLSETTALRRNATYKAWMEFVAADPDVRTAEIDEEMKQARAEAARIAAEREERRLASTTFGAFLVSTPVFTGTKAACEAWAAEYPNSNYEVRPVAA